MTATVSPAASVGADVATLRVIGKTVVADGRGDARARRAAGGRLPTGRPGAHIDLRAAERADPAVLAVRRPLGPATYRVGVLREPDGRGGSAYVHDQLAVGDVVGVGGPRNNFPLVPAERYLFVAGGIGITPLLPMIAQAELLGADWRLLYGGRRRASMAFLDELAGVRRPGAGRPAGRARPARPAGFLGDAARRRPDLRLRPAPLLAAMEAACAGWPPHTVRTERFVADERRAPVRATPFEVELARTGATVTVTPDMTILDALGQVGVEVLSSCRRGVCGTCETTVLAGRPDHRDALLDDEERDAADCMYVCVSRSCTDRLVLDL